MHIARVLNAAIAIIEDRFPDAREMLRGEEVDPEYNAGVLQSRLYSALETRSNRSVLDSLHLILREALRLAPPKEVDRESYYRGVSDLETVIEGHVKCLEPGMETL